jgi:hypothetical protein
VVSDVGSDWTGRRITVVGWWARENHSLRAKRVHFRGLSTTKQRAPVLPFWQLLVTLKTWTARQSLTRSSHRDPVHWRDTGDRADQRGVSRATSRGLSRWRVTGWGPQRGLGRVVCNPRCRPRQAGDPKTLPPLRGVDRPQSRTLRWLSDRLGAPGDDSGVGTLPALGSCALVDGRATAVRSISRIRPRPRCGWENRRKSVSQT